jgi:hypothetical protein
MTLRREVGMLRPLPKGYAIAWYAEDRQVAICLPVGLHVVAGAARALWQRVRAWQVPSIVDEASQAGYRAGFARGRETGHAEALRCTAQSVDRFLKKSGVLDAIGGRGPML